MKWMSLSKHVLLTGYEAKDPGEPESSLDSSQVLDLSSRDVIPEELTTPFAPPEPSMVKPLKTSSPASTKSEFQMKVVGIHKHKPKYSFKCSVCGKIMYSVWEWNIHHRKKHSKIVFSCEDCGKGFQVPSSLRDHRYLHRGQPFIYNTCQAKFTFYSGLQLHRNLHSSTQMHICFSGGCDKKYCWPQDLLRHLNKHHKHFFDCELCAYKTHQKRLLHQHKPLHCTKLIEQCKFCDRKFHWACQKYRHMPKCDSNPNKQ